MNCVRMITNLCIGIKNSSLGTYKFVGVEKVKCFNTSIEFDARVRIRKESLSRTDIIFHFVNFYKSEIFLKWKSSYSTDGLILNTERKQRYLTKAAFGNLTSCQNYYNYCSDFELFRPQVRNPLWKRSHVLTPYVKIKEMFKQTTLRYSKLKLT